MSALPASGRELAAWVSAYKTERGADFITVAVVVNVQRQAHFLVTHHPGDNFRMQAEAGNSFTARAAKKMERYFECFGASPSSISAKTLLCEC